MNEYLERATLIAEKYEMFDLKTRLESIQPTEDVPYLKVGIVPTTNRLPNLIFQKRVLPERLVISNQEPVCITFDNSVDEELRTIQLEDEQWRDTPIRFYVAVWDKAFREDGTPDALMEKMDVIIFGMDVETAFRRSMMERIAKTQVWDAMIVVEGLEKIPDSEIDEFIQLCLQRTCDVNMRGDQLVFLHKQVPEVAYAHISSKILSPWKNLDTSTMRLQAFRSERNERNCRKWVAEEMRGALNDKICQVRREMIEEGKRLHTNREARAQYKEIDEELACWTTQFMQSLETEIEDIMDAIKNKSSQYLLSVPLTQKQIDDLSAGIQMQWADFAKNKYKEMEIGLLEKLQELWAKYNVSGKIAGAFCEGTSSEIEAPMLKNFWFNPMLLAGVGIASWLCNGLAVTLVLAIPLLKIKQLMDKKGIIKKLDEANLLIAVEIKKAFHKDLVTCKKNAIAVIEMETLSATEGNLETIRCQTDTLKALCQLLEDYER